MIEFGLYGTSFVSAPATVLMKSHILRDEKTTRCGLTRVEWQRHKKCVPVGTYEEEGICRICVPASEVSKPDARRLTNNQPEGR